MSVTRKCLSGLVDCHILTLGGRDPKKVERLFMAIQGEMNKAELMDALGLSDRNHFTDAYLRPEVEANLAEMTSLERLRGCAQR